MYTVYDYAWMINDRLRTDAYIEALKVADVRGKVVLDIGTGTGVFALLACHFGARKVYALEPDDVIQIARQCAAANNFDQRISFIGDHSTKITLPEQANVIISDLRGTLPVFQQHLHAIIDARERHLAPHGLMIPQQDSMWAAVVESPEIYKNYAPLWIDSEFELDTTAARSFAVNTFHRVKAEPEEILLLAQCWATLDYNQLTSSDLNGEISWMVDRPGIAHGLLIWFDTTLIADIGFSNAPDLPEKIYRQLFFPFTDPVELHSRDEVTVTLAVTLTGDRYIWRWHTLVRDQTGVTKIDYDQSTFFSTPKSPALWRKKAAGYIPTLEENGQIDSAVLNLMQEKIPLGEIADQLVERFPLLFPDWEAALAHVGELSQKYSS